MSATQEPQTEDEDIPKGLNGWEIAIIIIGVGVLIAIAIAVVGIFFPVTSTTTFNSGYNTSGVVSGSTSSSGSYIQQNSVTIQVSFTNGSQDYPTSGSLNCQFTQSGSIVTLTMIGTPQGLVTLSAGGAFTAPSGTIPAGLRPSSDTIIPIIMANNGGTIQLGYLYLYATGGMQFSALGALAIANTYINPSAINSSGTSGVNFNTTVTYSLQ